MSKTINEIGEHGRQGDVLVVRVVERKDHGAVVPPEDGRVILAHGEVTGHAHALRAPDVVMFRDGGSEGGVPATYVRVEADLVALSHEEHGPGPMAKGDYEVVRQCEYTPVAVVSVAD